MDPHRHARAVAVIRLGDAFGHFRDHRIIDGFRRGCRNHGIGLKRSIGAAGTISGLWRDGRTWPANDLRRALRIERFQHHFAIQMLDECRAILHPVTDIYVDCVAQPADTRSVNMATDDTVAMAFAYILLQSLFKMTKKSGN